MSNTNIPTLSTVIDGLVFNEQEAGQVIDVDHKQLEISCIDLLSKLENVLANARVLDQDDFIDESGIAAQKIVDALSQFSEKHLTGQAAAQAKEENDRASAFVAVYREFLISRPLSKKLIRAFWVIQESDDVLKAHAKLGDALVRACAATLYHAVVTVGLDSKFGKEIDQSTVVFIEQLHESWN